MITETKNQNTDLLNLGFIDQRYNFILRLGNGKIGKDLNLIYSPTGGYPNKKPFPKEIDYSKFVLQGNNFYFPINLSSYDDLLKLISFLRQTN